MSGDSNGYNRGQGHPGEPGEPAQSPWSVRPGPPVYQGPGSPGADPYGPPPGQNYGGAPGYGQEAPQDPYGATQSAPYGQQGQYGRQAYEQPTQAAPASPFPAAAHGNRDGEPDWGALAEEAGRSNRRRRVAIWAGAVVGVLAIGAGIAFASIKISEGDDAKPAANTGSGSAAPATSAPAAPKPTFKPAPSIPPAPGAAKVLADPALDTAPFTAAELFPDAKVTQGGRTYTVVGTQLDNTCANAVNAELAKILRNNQCAQMIRVTVTAADGTAATVALGAFATPEDAKAAAVQGNEKYQVAAVTGLPGGPVKALCPEPTPGKPGVQCARQTNSYGRYGIFAVVGYPGTENKLTGPDPKVDQLGNDVDAWVRAVLEKRGEKTSQAIYEKAKADAEKQLQG
ncbi:hypothetical protein [Yinghuangia soli]|uniref:Uncharacterized protein n=1 Tax=Yinghuangia soli TaxID=2908204 RepID=A0AA41Q223_9ACTN|nr:hypothetical protein [Yinghuangia soli]MCF2530119.1 hypothetical protein [Yinghuangia soli]